MSVKEYQLKALTILHDGVMALVEHFKVDEEMQNLQETINAKSQAPAETETNSPCACRRGESWKKEIGEKKYWVSDPEPFRNIRKFAPDHHNKHTTDIHQLYQVHGYLKLASVFLTKRQMSKKSASDCKDISEYLHHDGILQLLMRCNVFSATPEQRNSIKEVC